MGELVVEIDRDESLPPVSAGLLYVATSSGGLLRVSDLRVWRRMQGGSSRDRVAGRFGEIASDTYAAGYHLGPWWSLVHQVCTTGRALPTNGWEFLAPSAACAQNPCNPCCAKQVSANPCAAANPCNPCAAKNPCSPCAAKNPCNPCAAKQN